ncbi:E3 ubiquitin-protein ligase RNF170-like [Dendronephthya gigantea]|uniref:E3 ubiquitin-protein ligase RNF170-like n=1 Tax=Dendronephthya gigantea TaxID=151771 RepID=UPI001069C5C0|nr:E3 ubiquitin-protein ligase RNF170-like [Dendronephthya gigantea]
MADVWWTIFNSNAKQSDKPTVMYVEGVGNEVLLGLGASLAILIPLFISVFVKRSCGVQIHPDEAENVQATRETLGVGENTENNERTNVTPPRNINDGEPCPICLMPPHYLIITNCGHGFCGQCLITYWQTRFIFRAMTCPVCRQQITMLFISFDEAEITEQSTSIQNSVHQYNRRFSSQPRTIMEYIQDLPTLLAQLFHELFNGTGLVLLLRFRIIVCFLAALLYFVSPIDILSEAAFGLLGFLDDIVIALLVLFYVSEVYRNVVADRAANAVDG